MHFTVNIFYYYSRYMSVTKYIRLIWFIMENLKFCKLRWQQNKKILLYVPNLKKIKS